MEDVEQHDGIAHDGVDHVHDIHIPYHLHAACGSASRQYPGIAEFRVEGPQLIHVLQYGHQFLLRLEHVGGHALVVLPGHHLEELVEILRVGLRQFQGIHHAHGLFQVVIALGQLLTGQRFVGRHEIIDRPVVG